MFQSNLTQRQLISLSNFVKLYDLMNIMQVHDGCFNFSRRRIDLFQHIKILSRLVASKRDHVNSPLLCLKALFQSSQNQLASSLRELLSNHNIWKHSLLAWLSRWVEKRLNTRRFYLVLKGLKKQARHVFGTVLSIIYKYSASLPDRQQVQ